jgi:hypothetical protein
MMMFYHHILIILFVIIWHRRGLEHVLFSHILGIIIPTDFHIFQRGRSTTNQVVLWFLSGPKSLALFISGSKREDEVQKPLTPDLDPVQVGGDSSGLSTWRFPWSWGYPFIAGWFISWKILYK